jgi:hypothetical protein
VVARRRPLHPATEARCGETELGGLKSATRF